MRHPIFSFFRLNAATNLPGCGLIHERHDFSRKVVIGCGDQANVEVWEVDSHLVYTTAHACPGAPDAGQFKELDNNYHDHEDFNTKYNQFKSFKVFISNLSYILYLLQSIGVH